MSYKPVKKSEFFFLKNPKVFCLKTQLPGEIYIEEYALFSLFAPAYFNRLIEFRDRKEW